MSEMTEATTAAPVDGGSASATDVQQASSAKAWRARITRCRKTRKELIKSWADNVDYRRGKPFAQESDEHRVNVNIDWSLTKGKHSQLFSQVPQVYLTPKTDQIVQQIAPFAKKLNDTLGLADMGTAVDEAVLDTINAAGIGIALVSYEATTAMKDMPVDPNFPELTIPTKQTVDKKYCVRRLSPSDFLWPVDFTGSNFDDADWLGHSGTMLWSDAKRAFNLSDEDKEQVVGAKVIEDNLRQDYQSEYGSDDPVVEYDEIFYWMHRFNEGEQYFKKIGRVVFVEGKTEPVIEEAWAGQKFDVATGRYTGSCKFPVRVLTLTYISDDAIPPSDTAVGRPQVEELIESRSQIVKNRARSTPLRWGNTSLLDPMILDTIMRGEYQAIIPVNGQGERALGEIARASYPPEDWQFDRTIKGDLQEQWQISPNQVGAYQTGEKSASEAKIVQQNFQTRIGYERARVGKFVVGIAEVMGGLLALYDDEIDPAIKQAAGELIYYIRPDSTVMLDADQRIDKLMHLLNLVGKSGFINPESIIQEIVALHGLDPAKVMTKPNQPPPDQPSIGYSFKGEDMLNPIALAILMRAGQAPTPQELSQAINVIKTATAGMMGAGPMAPTTPQPMMGPDGQPMPAGTGPVGQEPLSDARPGWTAMPRVNKRGPDEPGS